jgi:plastocyanin
MRRLSASAGRRTQPKLVVLISCLAIILAVGVIAASCGGGSGGGLYGGGGSTQTTTGAPTTAGPATTAAAPGTTVAGGAGGAQVVMKNFAFDPASVTIKAGDSVTWTNQDSTTHTVTADNGEFKSSDIAPGATFTFKFEKAGTFAYHCSIHPTMKATVVVQ